MNLHFGSRTRLVLLAMAGLINAALATAQVPDNQGQNYPPYAAGAPMAQPAYPQAGVAGQQQAPPQQYQPPGAQPNQPVGPPPTPTIEQRPTAGQPVYGPPAPPGYGQNAGTAPRPAADAPPPVPFVLSPQDAAQLDAVLAAWEKRNKDVKSINADMWYWYYDAVFSKNSVGPVKGQIRYASPDKGYFELTGDKPEKWISDGKSIFKYEYEQKIVREFRLPQELQGKAISDGPLPFVFGCNAQTLKQRYYLRLIPSRDPQNEVWIEAWPRLRQQASEFKRVEIIIKTNGMIPYAINMFEPNDKDHKVYQLENIVVNPRGAWLPLGVDVFHGSVPFMWKKIVETPPTQQTARAPGAAGR